MRNIIFSMVINNQMSESGFSMTVHALFIGAILYAIMKYCLRTPENVAQDRCAFYGGLALIYMVMFGHGAPTRVNSNLF
jgi:hypothetical protein